MRQLVLLLSAFFTFGFLNAQEVNTLVEDTGTDIVEVVADGYTISGPSMYKLVGDSGVGSTYTLNPSLPAGATVKWSIPGSGRAHVYPTDYGCYINIYDVGSYRLIAVITDSQGTHEAQVYINVYR